MTKTTLLGLVVLAAIVGMGTSLMSADAAKPLVVEDEFPVESEKNFKCGEDEVKSVENVKTKSTTWSNPDKFKFSEKRTIEYFTLDGELVGKGTSVFATHEIDTAEVIIR
jgi:hypothetical protein